MSIAVSLCKVLCIGSKGNTMVGAPYLVFGSNCSDRLHMSPNIALSLSLCLTLRASSNVEALCRRGLVDDEVTDDLWHSRVETCHVHHTGVVWISKCETSASHSNDNQLGFRLVHFLTVLV